MNHGEITHLYITPGQKLVNPRLYTIYRYAVRNLTSDQYWYKPSVLTTWQVSTSDMVVRQLFWEPALL